MTEVRTGGKGVKVVPRILFEEWSMHDFMELFGDSEKMDALGDYMGRQLKSHKFDGAVLEVWSQLGGRHRK